MRRILITGGSGFIGTHLIESLLKETTTIINADLKPPILQHHQSLWRKADVLSIPEMAAIFEENQPDVIFHMAARADIFSENLSDFASIFTGTTNVAALAAARRSPVHFIHVSTQLVVAPGASVASDEEFYPYTVYGEAKAEAERIVRAKLDNTYWTIVRPTNIWGPYHPSFGQSIWRYIAQRKYLHPKTPSPVIRSYGYVQNTVDQLVSIMKHAPATIARKVLYLGDAEIDSSEWLDGFSIALTGRRVRRAPLWLLRPLAFAGDQAVRVGLRLPLDSGRLMRMSNSYRVPLAPIRELCGAPAVSLDEGVTRTVTWLCRTFPNIYGEGSGPSMSAVRS